MSHAQNKVDWCLKKAIVTKNTTINVAKESLIKNLVA